MFFAARGGKVLEFLQLWCRQRACFVGLFAVVKFDISSPNSASCCVCRVIIQPGSSCEKKVTSLYGPDPAAHKGVNGAMKTSAREVVPVLYHGNLPS